MTDWSTRLSFDPSVRKVLVQTGKVEIGQHVHSAFAKIVADVLGIDADCVSVLPVSTATSPDDGLTAGSLSIQVTGATLESAAVNLRATLLEEAALRLNVRQKDITFIKATLEVSGEGRRCSIFDLPASQHQFAKASDTTSGTGQSISDSVRGNRNYIQDLSLPGMIHSRALRGRNTGELDDENVWFVKDGGFAAIVAQSQIALDLAWKKLGEARPKGDASCDGPIANWIADRRVQSRISGDVASIKGTVRQSATRPFLLHASIAPSCAIARLDNGTLEIWTHSQGIFVLRDAIALQLGMDADRVIVRHVPSAGSYGHNAADDAAMDAVLVCLQNEGLPVRVCWTRQDEFQHSPVGAPMKVDVEADCAKDGSIVNWRQTIWSGPHGQRPGGGGNVNLLAAIERDPSLKSEIIPDLPETVGGGAARNSTPPYAVGSFGTTTHVLQDLPVRSSSIRGLGAQMNVIAIEATMEKLADACAMDSMEFRLKHINSQRGAEVLRCLKSTLEITAPLQEDEAIGIAYSRYKDKAAFAAVAARVRLAETVELLDVWAVVDAGRIADVSGALNQIEGGIIQAASWTLCEGVLLREGYIDAEGWEDYPIMGWSEIPKIHTSLVGADSKLPRLGIGECMVGPASAAIVNGVSKLVGSCVADLPVSRERVLATIVAG